MRVGHGDIEIPVHQDIGLLVQLDVAETVHFVGLGVPDQVGVLLPVHLQGHGLVDGGHAHPQASAPIGRGLVASVWGHAAPTKGKQHDQ